MAEFEDDHAYEHFTCRIVRRGDTGRFDVESGFGVVVEIEQQFQEELLRYPSCLQKKLRMSATESLGFALITAHSNLYEDEDSKNQLDKPVVEYIADDYAIVLENSVEIPLRDCVLRLSHAHCPAVSCCGVDSVLILDDAKLSHTLRAHRIKKKCCIEYDFVIVLLDAKRLRQHECCLVGSPPKLDSKNPDPCLISQDSALQLYWRDAEGMVKKERVEINSTHPTPQIQCLGSEIEHFSAQQSISYQQKGCGGVGVAYIGAPVIIETPTGGKRILGINVGNAITTLYGIFELLKGGLLPFLAAMVPKHSDARPLMPSRWKDHVRPFISTLLSPSYVLELLHHLLIMSSTASASRILKFDLTHFEPDIVSGLEIYTDIFKRYNELTEGKAVDGGKFEHKNENGEACDCFGKIISDMTEISTHFSGSENPPLNIVVALFKCFESMQRGFNYQGMAHKILENNMKNLIKFAKNPNIDQNADVNYCFKWIVILDKERRAQPIQEQEHGSKPVQVSNSH